MRTSPLTSTMTALLICFWFASAHMGLKMSILIFEGNWQCIIDNMNPNSILGYLTIIVHMGSDKLYKTPPSLIHAIQKDGKSVLWISDLVHGNTFENETK
eukprot:12132905-Ditylum_brightwellii.AAC.1